MKLLNQNHSPTSRGTTKGVGEITRHISHMKPEQLPAARNTRPFHYSSLPPSTRPPLAVVPVIPLYASTRIQKGMKTQRVLKKNKYTHLYKKLDVTRLGEPLSHSGANVIHPALDQREGQWMINDETCTNASAREKKIRSTDHRRVLQ